MNSRALLASLAYLAAGEEATKQYKIQDFKEVWFWLRPEQGFYEVDVNLNSDEMIKQGQQLHQIVDLDNDKANDLVTVSNDGKFFQPHYFDSRKLTFQSFPAINPGNCEQIKAVYTGKDADLLQDVLLLCQDPAIQVTELRVLKQEARGAFTEMEGSKLTLKYDTQPFFADFNGDLKLDVLYTDGSGKLKVAFQKKKGDYDMEIKDFVGNVALSSSEVEECLEPTANDQLSVPHSSSYIDLDGDCMPDIFLTRGTGNDVRFEIYIQKRFEKEQRYCLVQKTDLKLDPITQKVPLVEFGDMNRDGMFDMVFFLQKKIYTLYNKMKAQSATNTDLCRKAASDESLKNYRIFDDVPLHDTSDYDPEFVNSQTIEGVSNYNTLKYSADGVPGRVRLGDIDADGYPDIILTTSVQTTVLNAEGQSVPVLESSTSGITSNTYVLKNEKGDECKKQVDKMRRCYKVDSKDLSEIRHVLSSTSVVQGTFMDIDEDGRLDIVFQVREKVNGSYTNSVKVIYNNQVKDTFFIKAQMLNSYKSYGDVVTGPSFRAVITDLDDRKEVIIGSQLTQSSYLSLQLPYAYVGVGRSNNYVEQFTAGYAVNGNRAIRPWSPIIPNSQLIVQAGDSNTNKWNLELFVNPTDALPLIIIACVICLVVIGVIICALYYREKMDDKKDRKEIILYF